MRLAAPIIITLGLVMLFVVGKAAFPSVMDWAVSQQRAFQNEMAGAVRAIRSGAPGGWLALLLAAGSYGVVHAAGPGHGKYLIGGVGLASKVPVVRMIGLAIASSLTQALWAVVLVYGGFSLLQLSANNLTVLAEDWLAPASYLAIGGVGIVLVLRALRMMIPCKSVGQRTHPNHGECCNHSHGPTPEQAASVQTYREAAGLVASIAIRPCTGAIFLLVIAWQQDIKLAGFAAVVAMGLGTGVFTSTVALSSVTFRDMALFSGGKTGTMRVVAPVLQLAAGILVLWFSLALFSSSIL